MRKVLLIKDGNGNVVEACGINGDWRIVHSDYLDKTHLVWGVQADDAGFEKGIPNELISQIAIWLSGEKSTLAIMNPHTLEFETR
jgi:hypothetical protein